MRPHPAGTVPGRPVRAAASEQVPQELLRRVQEVTRERDVL